MVRPILEYGAQVLTYQKYYLKSSINTTESLNKLTVIENKLEHFQTQALKKLILGGKNGHMDWRRMWHQAKEKKGCYAIPEWNTEKLPRRL